MNNKSFSQSCENNKEPILKVLKQVFGPENRRLLEVGTGTAQHAVFFAKQFPDLHWVTSDRTINHKVIVVISGHRHPTGYRAPDSSQQGDHSQAQGGGQRDHRFRG